MLSCEGNPTVKDRNAPVPLCTSGSPGNAAAQSQLPRSEVEIIQPKQTGWGSRAGAFGGGCFKHTPQPST